MSGEPVRHRLGILLWLVRPLYLVVELVVAAAATAQYSLLDDTISDLGATRCTGLYAVNAGGLAADGIAVCSPWHPLMNANFIVTGLLLAVGALLLSDRFGRGLAGRAIVVLLVVSGLSSAGVGLVPLDRDESLHFLVAAPVFVTQPLALVLIGALMWRRRRAAATALIVVGAVTAAGALGFVVGGESGSGLLERIAIWPPLVALAWVALDLRGRVAPPAREGY